MCVPLPQNPINVAISDAYYRSVSGIGEVILMAALKVGVGLKLE